jgi:membrane fusion protein (multidrug efflux system)
MKNVFKTIVFIIIALVIIGAILYPKFKTSSSEPVSYSPEGGRSELPVDVMIVEPERVENIIRITGAIQANESISLRSEISGKVEKIYFNEGQRVKKGDLLVSINDDEIVAQIERLKYTQKLNEDIEFRQRQLLEKEAISREEYEIALTTLNTIRSDIKQNEARLAKHHIRAPFNGIIGLREISEGSYITPSDLIGNLYSINPVKIEFSVPGKYSTEIHNGDTIVFSVEVSDDKYTGNVYAYEPKIDATTRTLRIRALCENRQGVLLPGQYAKISYVLDIIPDALLVPSESVVPELNGHRIFVLNGGKVDQRAVEIGLRTEKSVQITEGISAGDTVITTGILQVRPGMPVAVSEIIE